MKSLDKSGNEFDPQLSFNAESGTLRMSGKSIPLDTDQILAEIITWLEDYAKQPKDQTKLEIDLSYLNGKSLRTLISIFNELKKMSESGSSVSVEWKVPKDADDLVDLSEIIFQKFQLPHEIKAA